MTTTDLHSKLINSLAVESLTAEQVILSSLQTLNWEALHGSFYSDLKTGKLRELDVVGRQVWQRKLKRSTVHADLRLIIESKSIRGFHLVFSQLKRFSTGREAN